MELRLSLLLGKHSFGCLETSSVLEYGRDINLKGKLLRMRKKLFWTDVVLLFLLAMIGAAEVAQLCGVFLHWPFSRCVPVFGVTFMLSVSALCGMLFFMGRKQEKTARVREKLSGREKLFAGLAVVLFLSQAGFILCGSEAYVQGDMTVETVGSFLQTDAFYQVNPITGTAYREGIPTRLEILCLPTLYGTLCRITGLSPAYLIRRIIPVVSLCLSYLAYLSLAKTFFGETREKRLLFLTAVAALVWIGSYRYGVDGFGLLYSGWRGVTLRNTVLLPFLLSLALRKRYVLAFGCLMAEACIVWTFYGLGACAALLCGVLLCGVLRRRFRTESEAADD